MANVNVKIEIVYATPGKQLLLEAKVLDGSTVKQAIEQSGILQHFPEIDLAHNKVGVFSKRVELDTVVHEGDRIEIYRPLLIDPKEARRARAKK